MTGPRNQKNVLWDIQVELLQIDSPLIHQANGIVNNKTTKTDLFKLHHNSLGNPTKHSLIKAVNQGHIATFHDLDEMLVTKHLPRSIDSAEGHLQQEVSMIA